jgi:sugar lactone lactonase YvrE
MLKKMITLAAIYFCALLSGCGGGGTDMTTAAAGTQQVTSNSGGSATQQAAALNAASASQASQSTPLAADPTQARFLDPNAISFSANGDLYVADAGTTIRKIAKDGVVTTLAGAPGTSGSVDGSGSTARFSTIKGLAIDASGNNIYVTDSNTIRKVTPSGAVTTLAGAPDTLGYVDAVGADARFRVPQGIAVDCACNLFIADSFNFVIRKLGQDGTVSTFAGGDTSSNKSLNDGVGTHAKFAGPTGIAIDSANNLYVTDVASDPSKAPILQAGSTFIRKITPEGVVTTLAGTFGNTEGPSDIEIPAQFADVSSIVLDSAGNVYVIDHIFRSSSIKKLAPDGTVSTLMTADAGSHWSALAFDNAGNLYIAGDNAIYKVTQSGMLSVFAGKPNEPGSNDTP